MGAVFSKRSSNVAVGRRHSWAAQESAPVSLYKSFGGSFNQLRCVMHELGSNKKCHSENYLKQKGDGAIVGIHSNWIGDSILACARPSDRLIKDHHLIHQFHSQHIGAVINLQEPGEHAGCGDGVIPETGFAYNPGLFTQDNIAYFNFPWSRARNFMDEKLALSICQAIDSRIAESQKVAVHCHSGIGRTGLIIACFLVYSGAQDPLRAIQEVRKERPGTLKNKSQEQLVGRFNNHVRHLKIQFVPPEQRRKNLTHGAIKSYPTLVDSMVRQNEILYGKEKQALHYVPKVLDWLTRDLIRRTEFNRQKREQIALTFIIAFTTDLSLSPDDELVQRAKEPMVPDSILTTALGRGDIESAIDELSKCDQCSFATLQCLACWMFQMVPVQPKLIRRLYSALAHVLLASTTLQNDQRSPFSSPGQASKERHPNTFRRHTVNRMNNAYANYKPSLLEIEFGLLLEAAARFWIKLGVARKEELESKNKQTVNTAAGPSASSSSMPVTLGTVALKMRDKHRLGSFSQPWFRDRASLAYEQYNPESAPDYKKEMERGSIGGPSTSFMPSPSRFAEQNQQPMIPKGEQKKGVVQEKKSKPVPQAGKTKTAPQQEKPKLESVDDKKNLSDQHQKKKAVAPEEKKRVTAQDNNKPMGSDAKKKLPSSEEKTKATAHAEKTVVKGVQKKTK